jgi:hypothetical protein
LLPPPFQSDKVIDLVIDDSTNGFEGAPKYADDTLDHHESWSLLDPDDNGIPPVVVDDGSDNEAGKDESGYATEDEIAPVQAPAPQIYQFNPVLSNHPLAVSFQLLNYDETPTDFLQLDQLFLQWHIPRSFPLIATSNYQSKEVWGQEEYERKRGREILMQSSQEH